MLIFILFMLTTFGSRILSSMDHSLKTDCRNSSLIKICGNPYLKTGTCAFAQSTRLMCKHCEINKEMYDNQSLRFIYTSGSNPLTLYCDQFNHGSDHSQREPVDLVTIDFDVTLWQRNVFNFINGNHVSTTAGKGQTKSTEVVDLRMRDFVTSGIWTVTVHGQSFGILLHGYAEINHCAAR